MKYRNILGVVSSGTQEREPPRKRTHEHCECDVNKYKKVYKEKTRSDVGQIKIIIVLFVNFPKHFSEEMIICSLGFRPYVVRRS
jgi:hypothetical protein